MTWNIKQFLAEYDVDECYNRRCLNRKTTLKDRAEELRETRALLRKIMRRAEESDSVEAREIYIAIANHNLGHRNHSAELPRSR